MQPFIFIGNDRWRASELGPGIELKLTQSINGAQVRLGRPSIAQASLFSLKETETEVMAAGDLKEKEKLEHIGGEN